MSDIVPGEIDYWRFSKIGRLHCIGTVATFYFVLER